MNFTVVEVPQRSEAWFACRLGRVTGSVAADMLSKPKNGKGESAGRRNLRVRLALERITGRSLESSFQSRWMQQGIDREADAALHYEALTGRFLSTTGFLRHDSLMAGCSLDGHVGDFEGIVEAKSPIPAVHLDYIRTGRIPGDYYSQVIHNLFISGAAWCDWISFNPDFPEPLQLKLVRVERNEPEMVAYQLALSLFLSEVEREHDDVMRLAAGVAA